MELGFWQGRSFCPDCDCDWVAIVADETNKNTLECPKCHELIGRML